MVLKLPTQIQQEWLKVAYKIIKGGREPMFADLVDFVKEQADISNTRYGLLINRGSNRDNRDVGVLKGKISVDYNAARIFYASADNNAPLRSSSCLECLSNHSLDQCQKAELEDKFEQLHSTEFNDPFSHTSSMSVEDRIALPKSYKPLASQIHCSADASESAYGVAEYARSENVSRQVHCSFLSTKSKVFKPKTEAPSANKPKSTFRKPKEKKDTKLKVKTAKRPKATVTKKPVTKTLKKQAAHIRRGIEDGVEKGALVRVLNKSKGASGSFTGANAILRQTMCIWN
ncbi:unnamed protein product [Schistosoma mattheei]|uniref:H15 domain-containing protein n=1 Tax=Schistosoma mattheei TaxID=31246 RepID=A0A183NL46_9TREM|nr:unnamed protein product [Schistosoma mattheei]